jgi:hypothetical protein
VNTVIECTLPEKILLAASALEDEGQSPFSAEALIVRAWQSYPTTFGLKGYAEQYPDSNKILTALMGEKGLARKGWLSKVGQKLYSLTREGRQVVRRLRRADDESPPPAPVKLKPEHEGLLYELLSAAATQRFREGKKHDLTFADACRFWNVSNGLHGKELDARLERVTSGLTAVERLLANGTAALRDGRDVTRADVGLLADVHDFLEERFARHLALLRNRGARG